MEPMKARMDFEFENLKQELVQEIEDKINAEVKLNHRVSVKILPREEAFKIPDLIRTKINLLPEGISEVRIVEIENLDLQADGGTHVTHTAEIGHIKITEYKSKGKINKRMYITISDE
jgi:misacylated tRNA(Ala) deacylase